MITQYCVFLEWFNWQMRRETIKSFGNDNLSFFQNRFWEVFIQLLPNVGNTKDATFGLFLVLFALGLTGQSDGERYWKLYTSSKASHVPIYDRVICIAFNN